MFYESTDFNRDMMLYQEPSLNCKMTLQNKDLWQKFHELGTEMIITKSGRRMFPALRVQLDNLEPNSHYCVLVEMVPISKCRYKYSSSGGWAPAGSEEAQSPNRVYLHPESPSLGHHWMSQIVTFGRLKLTNTANPPPGHLVLSSMHRYQPRIIVVKSADPRRIAWAPHSTISFPETQFIAVTAYQNDKITKLKIDNNPFAKGFRENGQSKCKRKRQAPEDEEIIVDDDAKHDAKRADLHDSSESSLDTSDSSSERTASPEFPQNPSPQIYQPYNPHILPSYYYAYYHNPYNHFAYYNPYSAMQMPQDLSVHKEVKPRKLTDFSIRAITGMS